MKAIIPTELDKRISDNWGQGHFGAPRGDRTHSGIDYICPAGSAVLAPVDGLVTKIGYPYASDLSYRYVQLTTPDGYNHRIFYVLPLVEEGDKIKENQVIGMAQDLEKRYPDITPHVHYECKYKGSFINPENISGKI